MFGLGIQELLIILVLVLIIFGAGKLPQVGGAVGKAVRNFKAGVNDEGHKEEQEDDGRKQK
jgi:sec-independent protein translocase protein TatA